MLWMNGCNAMLKWEKSRKSRKSTKVAYGPHTDIWKINESCTRSYKRAKDHIDGNASKPYISKMHNVQETQKNVSKQTRNRVFATSIFAIFIDFAFEF